MNEPSACPSDDSIESFLTESGAAFDRAAVEQHIEDCALCQQRMEDLASGADWQRLMPADRRVSLDATNDRPDQTQARPVTQIGRYRILRPIGRGGMGIVYLAEDPDLGRRVAVKQLAADRMKDQQWLSRFRREAKLASALNHPNILTIHEIGESAGGPFMVTEYVDGTTLNRVLAGRRLPLARALKYAEQVAAGVAAAHDAGIVHRDLKPENVMIRRDDLVKILDFGLARYSPDAPQHQSGSISHTGLVLGTVSYMSPEQARGQELDVSSDVFSFGTLLFLMLTGHRAFSGETPSDTMAAILTSAPRAISECNVDLPPTLSRLLMRCLSKQPEHRPPAAEVLGALREEQQRLTPNSAPSRPTEQVNELSTAITEIAGEGTELNIDNIRYTQSGEVNIAWQVVGNGPIDVVFVMGWVSHLEWFWKHPTFASFLARLASFSRVILFDKRGTGLSDKVPVNELPTLETRMDDVRAVMEAAGSERAVLCGVSEGGPLCTLFAATYPHKTIALTMIGCYARRLWAEDYPWGPTADQREVFLREIAAHWGGPLGIEDRAPSLADDPEFRKWWASYLRMGASPGAAVALTKMNAQIDVRSVLPSVQVPTLVIHRTGDRCLLVEEGRHMADLIPGAKFVELPGDDHLPFVGDAGAILEEIEEFLTGMRHAPEIDRVLATVLCIVVEQTTATGTPEETETTVARFHELVGREAALFRGQNMVIRENRILLTFDGPARAVRAASQITALASRLNIQLRCGADTGACDIARDSITGPPADGAIAIAAAASLQAILISESVYYLVSGSGLDFVEAAPSGGTRTLYRLVR